MLVFFHRLIWYCVLYFLNDRHWRLYVRCSMYGLCSVCFFWLPFSLRLIFLQEIFLLPFFSPGFFWLPLFWLLRLCHRDLKMIF